METVEYYGLFCFLFTFIFFLSWSFLKYNLIIFLGTESILHYFYFFLIMLERKESFKGPQLAIFPNLC